MKIFKISVLIVIVLVLLYLNKLKAATELSVIDIGIGEELKISAAVAATPMQRWQGLKGVEKMPRDYQGMLFVYNEEAMRYFTMEGTLMNLDIVFMDKNKVITIIFNDVEKYWEYIVGKKPVTISARAQYVLELPAGKAYEYGLEQGMELDFKLPREIMEHFKLDIRKLPARPPYGADDDDEEPPPPPPNGDDVEPPLPNGDIEPPTDGDMMSVETLKDPIGELFTTPGVKATKPIVPGAKGSKPTVKPPPKGTKPQKTKPPKAIKSKKVKPKAPN